MAIQNRRGKYEDFDKTKLVSGEWAVVTSGDPASNSGRSVYMCFEPGQVKRMATYEDMTDNVSNAITDAVKAANDSLQPLVTQAKNSQTAAAASEANAKTAETNAESAQATAKEYAHDAEAMATNALNSATAAEKSAQNAASSASSITQMAGATASAAGKGGTVPAPAAGKQDSALKGDGTYGTEIGGLDLQLSDSFINTWKSILGG